MIVSILAAMDERRGIGVENRLPWRLPADLRRFKALTMGHTLIAGSKTWESIGGPLAGRTMIVLTRRRGAEFVGALAAHSLEEALGLAEQGGETEVFVIGGGDVFAQALPRAERMYLTQVHAVTGADVYFPAYSAEDWRLLRSERYEADEQNQYACTFLDYVRVTGG
ncbi:MAG: dihydrofolate reductase [Chloroflexi bacterium]|nr:dihydrofolate reductase [Chloroflexota bacterium]